MLYYYAVVLMPCGSCLLGHQAIPYRLLVLTRKKESVEKPKLACSFATAGVTACQ